MKDKIEIKLPNPTLRLIHVPIVIGIILLGLFLWQWNSTGGLRKANRELKGINTELIETNEVISDKIKEDSLLILQNQIVIDSLIVSETRYKNQSYINRKRYEKLKNDYNTADSDDKWDIFTRTIDN